MCHSIMKRPYLVVWSCFYVFIYVGIYVEEDETNMNYHNLTSRRCSPLHRPPMIFYVINNSAFYLTAFIIYFFLSVSLSP